MDNQGWVLKLMTALILGVSTCILHPSYKKTNLISNIIHLSVQIYNTKLRYISSTSKLVFMRRRKYIIDEPYICVLDVCLHAHITSYGCSAIYQHCLQNKILSVIERL